MALSRTLFIVVALIATIFATNAVATEFIVGGDSGWTPGFDYQAWAADKTFRVGDALVFKYPPGTDNVVSVGASDFQSCSVPPTATPLTGGNDLILLGSPGKRWYISGVGYHCQTGQKLVIIVQPFGEGPSIGPHPVPAPSPLSLPVPVPVPIVPSPTHATAPSSEPPVPSPSPSPLVSNVPHFGAHWVPRKTFKIFRH